MNTRDLRHLISVTQTELSAAVLELTSGARPADEAVEAGKGPSFLQHLAGVGSSAQHLSVRSYIFLLHRMYGADLETLSRQLRRLISLGQRFVQLYGDGPVSLLRTPARINILGEHIDYVSYLPTASLPFGSREHDMLMLYRAAPTDNVRGASTLEVYSPFSFSLAEGSSPGTSGDAAADWLSFLYEHPARTPHWSNYVKGAAYFARLNCGPRTLRGFDFVIDSSIPAGGGASSSSALVVLASAAVRDANKLPYAPLELARGAAKAEWYVGTRGGEMDHITMCLAEQDHAVLISYLDQQTRQVALPGRQFRWITFFSHTADKGREVMIEYNERAAVSRIVLPALIEGWKTRQPERYEKWLRAARALETETDGTLDEIETLLRELPQTMTLTELGQDYPEALAACARSFPILVAERAQHPLQLRSRSLHHIGEVRRVKTATQILENLSKTQVGNDVNHIMEAAMCRLGGLLDQTHASLRDLYEVSTPEVDRLMAIIRTSPGVYGAHLMGGGFGGNILALVSDESIGPLIERVQAEYYGPQNRQGVAEGSVMISTPGEGLAPIDIASIWREAIAEFNTSGSDAPIFRASVNAILDNVELDEDVWPIIVAAGKGTRSLASGLATPKPLAPVSGKPAILHVLHNVRAAFGQTRHPIVIVSAETEEPTRALVEENGTFAEVIFVVQPEALGTGDAVLCAREQMQGFQGRAAVIWGTQPVIRPETMRRALKLSTLFETYQMVFPTALKDRPYAPLLRDERGGIQSARETHLEQAEPLQFGESNIGMFILKSEPMFKALNELKQRYWDKTERRYLRPGGELGFPNELVNYFATRENGVLAAPIADSREEQGIKKLTDIAACAQFIAELAEQ